MPVAMHSYNGKWAETAEATESKCEYEGYLRRCSAKCTHKFSRRLAKTQARECSSAKCHVDTSTRSWEALPKAKRSCPCLRQCCRQLGLATRRIRGLHWRHISVPCGGRIKGLPSAVCISLHRVCFSRQEQVGLFQNYHQHGPITSRASHV